MKRDIYLQSGSRTHAIAIEENGSGWTVVIDGRRLEVSARLGERGRLTLEVDGRHALAHVARAGATRWVHLDGQVWALERTSGVRSRPVREDAVFGPIVSAMPGRVLDVLVQEGEQVRRGQTLLLLEAMKMELSVAAPADGVVRAIQVSPGQVIERGAALLEIARE